MGRGATKRSEDQLGIDNSYASAYNDTAKGLQSKLLPFYQGEMSNPAGLGRPTLDKMMTQSGQATSGSVGAGNEAATLAASRTGNSAALPGVIDANARNGMVQHSNDALDVGLADAKTKQLQQQAGAAGMSGMYGQDTHAALSALGLSEESLGNWNKADENTNAMQMGYLNTGLKAAGVLGA